MCGSSPMLVHLQSGVEYIRSVVSDQFSEDQMIEAMKHCNLNPEAALNHLLEKGAYSCVYSVVPYSGNYNIVTYVNSLICVYLESLYVCDVDVKFHKLVSLYRSVCRYFIALRTPHLSVIPVLQSVK